MSYSRREFGKLALAGLPAAAVLGRADSLFGAFAQAKPNSLINGVQIGTITYSYRSMPDQSAEATLKYILDSGISAIELMGGPVESFAGAPTAGRGGGAGAAPAAPAAAADPAAAGAAPAGAEPPRRQKRDLERRGRASIAGTEAARGRRRRRREAAAHPADLTPEQQARAGGAAGAAAKLKAWRTSVSMDPFKKLRKMYNDAGVSIYAWKQLSPNMSDEEFEYVFNVAEALGAHAHDAGAAGPTPAQLKRIGDFAMKKKIYAAYHTHAQGSMTAFDQAFAIVEGQHGERRPRALDRRRQRRRHADGLPERSTTTASRASI